MLTPEEIRLECLTLAREIDDSKTGLVDHLLEISAKLEMYVTGVLKQPIVTVTEEVCPPIPDSLKRTKAKDSEPEIIGVDPAFRDEEVTYDQVKAAVLEVAKTKGREASLDLLAPFGVVSGEGDKRVGSITKLKPEQFAAVIASAQAVLS